MRWQTGQMPPRHPGDGLRLRLHRPARGVRLQAALAADRVADQRRVAQADLVAAPPRSAEFLCARVGDRRVSEFLTAGAVRHRTCLHEPNYWLSSMYAPSASLCDRLRPIRHTESVRVPEVGRPDSNELNPYACDLQFHQLLVSL